MLRFLRLGLATSGPNIEEGRVTQLHICLPVFLFKMVKQNLISKNSMLYAQSFIGTVAISPLNWYLIFTDTLVHSGQGCPWVRTV